MERPQLHGILQPFPLPGEVLALVLLEWLPSFHLLVCEAGQFGFSFFPRTVPFSSPIFPGSIQSVILELKSKELQQIASNSANLISNQRQVGSTISATVISPSSRQVCHMVSKNAHLANL